MLRYLKGRVDLKTTLSANFATNKGLVFQWYIDAAFAIHADFKSHSGRALTMGKGSINNILTKQKLNTKSSTEAELVEVDDILMYVIWTKHFMEAQGYKTKENIICQDNQNAILLEMNSIK